MSQTVLKPEIGGLGHQDRWMVVIYNNETNSFDEVIGVLIAATRCDLDEAEIEAWEAHTFGKTPVHFADREECSGAADIISSIGVRAEVCLEWSS